jgi:hypothetical protein
MPTGYVYDEIYQQHDTRDHVEGKDRLTAIDAILEKTRVKEQLALIPPRPATVDEIAAVHWPSTMRLGEFVVRQRQRDHEEQWVVTARSGSDDPDAAAARVRRALDDCMSRGATAAVRVDDGPAQDLPTAAAVVQWCAEFEPDRRPPGVQRLELGELTAALGAVDGGDQLGHRDFAVDRRIHAEAGRRRQRQQRHANAENQLVDPDDAVAVAVADAGGEPAVTGACRQRNERRQERHTGHRTPRAPAALPASQ